MTTLSKKIDFWIFQSYAPATKSLPLYRIVFALLLIIFFLPRYAKIATLPDSFFSPPLSVAWFFSGFPPAGFFYGLDYLLELGAFCLLFGYRTRLVSLLMAGLIVIGSSFSFSIGKIDHDILVPLTLFCLAWSDWGTRHSVDAGRRDPSGKGSPAWPLTLLMLSIGLCMVTAAISKAKSGWLDSHVLACRGHLVLNYVGADRPKALGDFMLSITSPVFWKFIDWSTVTLEGAFLFAMFWLPAMRFVCALACLFHAFIYYSMDILFFANLAAYASLVDFRLLLRFRPARILLRRFDHLLHSVRLLPLAGLAALLYGIDIAGGNPEWRSNVALDSSASFLALVIGVSSLVYLSLRGMDRLLWDISFPLRGKTLIVLYDGECGLCDAWVQFVLKHDGKKSFQFASLQSDLGRRLAGTGDGKTADLSSVVLWIDGTTYRRSDAICIILRQFGFPWSTLGAMGFIPAFLRNAGYDFVAARRHKWFPPPASCRVPTREDKPRFLS